MLLSFISITDLAIRREGKKEETTSFCSHLLVRSTIEMYKMTILKTESNLVNQNENFLTEETKMRTTSNFKKQQCNLIKVVICRM